MKFATRTRGSAFGEMEVEYVVHDDQAHVPGGANKWIIIVVSSEILAPREPAATSTGQTAEGTRAHTIDVKPKPGSSAMDALLGEAACCHTYAHAIARNSA